MKKFASLLLVCIFVVYAIQGNWTMFAMAGKDIDEICEFQGAFKLGDYIVVGQYDGKPILWRYVLNDENGVLLLSDQILCEKSFDSNRGEQINPRRGSHLVFGKDANTVYLSAYWGDSNIRTWLNSQANSGEIDWLCGIAPENTNFKNECGFLSSNNFTKSQLTLLKQVQLRTILDYYNSEKATTGKYQVADYPLDAGFWVHKPSEPGSLDYYRNTIAETNSERMFLINFEQLLGIYNNYDVLGNYLNCTDNNNSNEWWLRDPYDGAYYHMGGFLDVGDSAVCVICDKDINKINLQDVLVSSEQGIRPAFYLNEENAQILSGSGTKEDPYVIDGKPVPERFEENGLYGYKDAEGNVIVPAKYFKAWEFSEGAALVVLPEDPYRLRYIDTDGNYLFDKAFYASNNFNNGYALVLVADDLEYSYINKTGELATELLFDDAEDFCGGYARVQIDGKWGVIDTNFNFKVPCEYDSKDEVLGKLDLS